MTDYVTKAAAEAEEYDKQRKQQAAEAIAQTNAAAAAEAQAALDETGAAIRDERRAALDTLDTAAVQKQLTLRQVRERMANLGLTASGTEAAGLQAAAVTETRQRQAAQRSRDEAVAALTEALRRTEATIESERAASELKETQDAEQDSASNRTKLMNAAYAAEAKEEAARVKAEATVEAARLKAAASAEKETLSAADRQYESNRKSALFKLYDENAITLEMYTRALEEGWTVDETLRNKEAFVRYNRIAGKAHELYVEKGFEAMMQYVAPYQLTDAELEALCYEIDVSRARVDKWMAGYQSFLDANPNAQSVLEIFERGTPGGLNNL